MLLPGSPMLASPPLARDSRALAVLAARSDTSTFAPFGSVTRWVDAPAGDGTVASGFAFGGRYQSVDTLVVRRAGLRPVSEVLRFQGTETVLRYDGARVVATIRRGDSTRTVERAYEHPVFAFNQMEMLARSLPPVAGTRVVVPLFSEVDLQVEYDTLTVLGPVPGGGRRAWTVRFADPVIVAELVVDGETRAVVRQDTRQRRSGSVIRYAPDGVAPGP